MMRETPNPWDKLWCVIEASVDVSEQQLAFLRGQYNAARAAVERQHAEEVEHLKKSIEGVVLVADMRQREAEHPRSQLAQQAAEVARLTTERDSARADLTRYARDVASVTHSWKHPDGGGR